MDRRDRQTDGRADRHGWMDRQTDAQTEVTDRRTDGQTGPALGMFEVFGRTWPPIFGGRQFWRPLRMQYVCMFVRSDFVVRHLVVLHILTNTRLLANNICTVQYSIMKACGGRGFAPNPAGKLTAPSRVRTPVKHTSLHNRLGMLKCSKTHLQQTIIKATRPWSEGRLYFTSEFFFATHRHSRETT